MEKSNKLLLINTTQMNLKIIMLTKRKWETKDKLHDSIFKQLWKMRNNP